MKNLRMAATWRQRDKEDAAASMSMPEHDTTPAHSQLQARRNGELPLHAVQPSPSEFCFRKRHFFFFIYFCNMLHVQSATKGNCSLPAPLHVALAKTTTYGSIQEPPYIYIPYMYTCIYTAIRKDWVSSPVEPLRPQTQTTFFFRFFCKNGETDTPFFGTIS